MREQQLSIASNLRVPAAEVLDGITMRAVNAELGPFVRMSAPREWSEWSIPDWPAGEHLFTSWILLLGILPVDRHRFFLEATAPGEGFTECSTSWVNARWRHQRRVIPITGGCRVVDGVSYASPLPGLGRLLLGAYRLVFRWRHHQLRLRYGSNPAGAGDD